MHPIFSRIVDVFFSDPNAISPHDFSSAFVEKVVDIMEKVSTGGNDRPRLPVTIDDCGQVSPGV